MTSHHVVFYWMFCTPCEWINIVYGKQQNDPLINTYGTFQMSHSAGLESQKLPTFLYLISWQEWLRAKHGVNDTSVTVHWLFAFTTGSVGEWRRRDWLGQMLSSQLPSARRQGEYALNCSPRGNCDRVIPLPEVIKTTKWGLGLSLAGVVCVCVCVFDISLKGLDNTG